ncbi:MAG TPA: membrane protein insertion efficiency factor YidD [Bacillota bacterium]
MKKAILYMIKLYQKFLSPLKPASCRFYPTCSQYTFQAVSRFGVTKGIILGIRRILRCNPFFKGGYDPIPDKIDS